MREFSRQEGQPVGREKDSCGERKDSQGGERVRHCLMRWYLRQLEKST